MRAGARLPRITIGVLVAIAGAGCVDGITPDCSIPAVCAPSADDPDADGGAPDADASGDAGEAADADVVTDADADGG